jgi:hypothetical protein
MVDHLHEFSGLTEEEARARKRAAVEETTEELLRLYLGGSKAPAASSENGVAEKRLELLRGTEAAAERATESLIAGLRDYVDLLADARFGSVPSRDENEASTRIALLIGRMREATGTVTTGLSSRIGAVIEQTRREQLGFFDRVEADNQGSLSRLYARLGGEGSFSP